MLDQSSSSAEINLVTIVLVIKKWKKNIIYFVAAAVMLAAVITFFLPRKYYSSATIYPTNPQLSDKSRLFNNNVEALYSVYGNADDLDRLYTIANTNNMYRFIADSFDLVNEKHSASGKEKVISKLKKHTSLKKTENGELVIGVWSKDPKLSAKMANAIVYKIEQIHNSAILDFNNKAIQALTLTDSTVSQVDSVNRINHKQLLDQIKISAVAAPAPFIILDQATPTTMAGRPRLLFVLVTTFIASLFFAILFALIADRNRTRNNA